MINLNIFLSLGFQLAAVLTSLSSFIISKFLHKTDTKKCQISIFILINSLIKIYATHMLFDKVMC